MNALQQGTKLGAITPMLLMQPRDKSGKLLIMRKNASIVQ